MADQNLNQQTETTEGTGGLFYIVRDIGAGLADFKISTANFLKPVTDAITALQAALGFSLQIEKLTSVTTNTTYTMQANTKLESIDLYHISGSVIVSVGTTLGGKQLIEDYEISSGADSYTIVSLFPTAQTLYITISGGTLNININYRLNQ